MSQTQAMKWSREKVLDVLSEFWDIEDWEDRGYDNDLSILANSERPSIFFDASFNKLYIEFPDENEELPNPDSRHSYPDLEDEIRSSEDIEKLREYLDNKTVEEIRQLCENDVQCILDNAYDAIRKELGKQLEEEIRKIREHKPEYKNFCGVAVVKRKDIYEETRNDGVVEYTAYVPSVVYEIDLDKVPSKDKLRCIIEEIMNDW